MNKFKNTNYKPIFICMVSMFCLTACKKNISESLPGGTADVAFNFYIASGVMDAAYTGKSVAVYMDKYQGAPPVFGTSSKVPYIGFGSTVSTPEYPSPNNGSINYVRYTAGEHRLFFTNPTNAVVLDTVINTKPETFNDLYLADVVVPSGAEAKYKLVVVEEDRKIQEEKTGVRFINLSPDAGNITCSLQNADGSLTATQAGELSFGQAAPYQYFGQGEVATGGLLRFTLSNVATGIKFNTGVPFDPGRNYVVLISGFHTDQRRLVATGTNPDGSIKKEIITINNNLKAEIRISY